MAALNWDPTEFQQAIQAWLDHTGMSQNQAADFCGISQSVLNRWMQTDRRYLVQPTPETLTKLAPKIGISHDELLRMAGRRSGDIQLAKPAELIALLRDVEAGYNATDEQERSMRVEATRSLWPRLHMRRPNNRRISGNNAGLDKPKMDYAGLINRHN